MSDIQCPMCGERNPAKLEVCQYCQARLKPLKIIQQDGELSVQPFEVAKPKGGDDLEASLPDWLRNLRQTNQPEFPTSDNQEQKPVLDLRRSILQIRLITSLYRLLQMIQDLC